MARLCGAIGATSSLGEGDYQIWRAARLAVTMGSIPLPVLDGQVAKFIASGGKGPYPDLE